MKCKDCFYCDVVLEKCKNIKNTYFFCRKKSPSLAKCWMYYANDDGDLHTNYFPKVKKTDW